MENNRIKESWSKIKPDDDAHERILNNILDRVHSGETKKGKVCNMTISPIKIVAPLAACLIVALAISIPTILNDGGGDPLPGPANTEGNIMSSAVSSSDLPLTNTDAPPSGANQETVIAINEVASIEIDRQMVDLHQADFVPMSKNEVIDFYGLDFFPKVIPSDMKEVEEGAFGIYRENEGVGDVYYSANLAWYVDENVSRQLQVEIDVGKLPFTDAQLISDGYEISVINGVTMVIKSSVDRYSGAERFVAEMIYEGNGLRVYSSNLTQLEFIGAVTSILQDASN